MHAQSMCLPARAYCFPLSHIKSRLPIRSRLFDVISLHCSLLVSVASLIGPTGRNMFFIKRTLDGKIRALPDSEQKPHVHMPPQHWSIAQGYSLRVDNHLAVISQDTPKARNLFCDVVDLPFLSTAIG